MADSAKAPPRFVAVGHNGIRVTSSDGLTWSKPQTGKEGDSFRAVCYGTGRFVAVGDHGGHLLRAASTDGENWKIEREGRYGIHIHGLCFGQGKFLSGGSYNGNLILASTDGLNWTDAAIIEDRKMRLGMIRRLIFAAERFIAIGDLGWRGVSEDGEIWSRAEGIKPIDSFTDIAYGNGVFVGVGLHGLRMVSKDGIVWTDRVVGEEGEHINSILWTGDRFAAIGVGVTLFSTDGVKWERHANKNAPLAAAYSSGAFIGSHWKGRLFHSKDAIEWKQVLKCDHHIEAVGASG